MRNLGLMDIRMAGINGYETTWIIKAADPNIKIIVQTAYATAADRQKNLDAGCDDYISKPLNKDILFEKIEEQLKNR
jgi:two-component system, cell cycle response regulator DivK